MVSTISSYLRFLHTFFFFSHCFPTVATSAHPLSLVQNPDPHVDDEDIASSQVNSLEALIRSMKNSAWKESGSGNIRTGPLHARELLTRHLSEEQQRLKERRRLRRIKKRPQAQPVMRRNAKHAPDDVSSPSQTPSTTTDSSSPTTTASASASLTDSSASAARTHFSKSEGVAELKRQEGIWAGVNEAYSDDTITCYHQHVGGSVHRFKYEVMIESDPAPVVAIARELDLMPNWHKFVSQSCVVEKIPADDGPEGSSFGGIWGYVELWFPWPLANRAMVVKCEVLDVLQETGSILVRLLSGDYDEAKLPTTADQCPRLVAQNLTQIVPLEPLPNGTPRTKFILFVDTDFQTNLIPGFVIQFILKVMAPVVYTQVKRLLETEFGGDTQFRERMAACPEMYGRIADRVQYFLAGSYNQMLDTAAAMLTSVSSPPSDSECGESDESAPKIEEIVSDLNFEDEGHIGSGLVHRLKPVRSAGALLKLGQTATSSFSDMDLLRRPLSAARQLSGHFMITGSSCSSSKESKRDVRASTMEFDQRSREDQGLIPESPERQQRQIWGEALASSKTSPTLTAPTITDEDTFPLLPLPSRSTMPTAMIRTRSAASLRLVLRPPERSVPPPVKLSHVENPISTQEDLPTNLQRRKSDISRIRLRPRARPRRRFDSSKSSTREVGATTETVEARRNVRVIA